MKDLHLLPKMRDSWSYLYVEHCQIDQDAKAIACRDVNGLVSVPVATLALLLLGPGTTITHAAVRTLAESGCSVVWVGEQAVRLYAQGLGETRSARRLMRQARLWSDAEWHLAVVRRMYQMRFPEPLDAGLTLQQIRGKEGVRVREAYARAAREAGVAWAGRTYQRADWNFADPVNRALSAANSCLYGVCHAAILAAGYSPALGFIHTGKQLSFVYDVADLYKAEVTVPAAFEAVAEDGPGLESRVRRKCRDRFRETRLLARVVADIAYVLDVDGRGRGEEREADNGGDGGDGGDGGEADYDTDEALPSGLWDPELGVVPGGVDYSLAPSEGITERVSQEGEDEPRVQEGQDAE